LEYVYGNGQLISRADLLKLPVSGRIVFQGSHYFHHDGLGSVVNLTDSVGKVKLTYDYDAFGEIIKEEGQVGWKKNRYTFIGGYGIQYDPASEFYYMVNRYYDFTSGRFITKDPVEGNIRLPISLHKYMYVYNNPIIFIDPLGLKTWIFVSTSGGGGYWVAVEGGVYYLIDPSTGEYYKWVSVSGGIGVGVGPSGGVQIEAGVYEGPEDPTTLSNVGVTVSGLLAAGRGISAQYTVAIPFGESEFGQGSTVGLAGGIGAGISIMGTYSWYKGKGELLPPEIQRLFNKIKKEIFK